jgi:hypothetical protein
MTGVDTFIQFLFPYLSTHHRYHGQKGDDGLILDSLKLTSPALSLVCHLLKFQGDRMDYLKNLIRFIHSLVVSKPTVPAYVVLRSTGSELRVRYRKQG